MKKHQHSPPSLPLKFFRWFCHPDLQPYIEGDLLELYDERLRKSGKTKADIRFVTDVLLLFRPGIIKSSNDNISSNNYDMIKSYLKIGWRGLIKNKGYSFINVAGLAAGMTVTILISLWIIDELSYDSYFKNHKQIAQVLCNQTNEGKIYTGTTISAAIGDPIQTKYGDNFAATSLVSYYGTKFTLAIDDKIISGDGRYVQQQFAEMFSLKMLRGDYNGLNDPSTIIIGQSLAKTFFGDSDPVNQTIRIENKFDMKVGGVYEDFPENTSFYDTEFLMPWSHPNNYLNTVTDFRNHGGNMFVQLKEGSSIHEVSEKIKNIPTPHIDAWKEELMLYPLDDSRLYNKFENGVAVGGRIQFVWLMAIIGVFVLLLACINFMNLSTARSEKRSKEVGIRKTIGSLSWQLIIQFLSESILVAFASLLLSVMLVQLLLPFFNSIADKHMVLPWTNIYFWLSICGFALFCGFISGSYPAFYLSSFKPVQVLKGTFKAGRFAALPRKVLVVVQFTVSITLIIGTVIVFKQIQFAKDRPVGYSREGLLTVSINSNELRNHIDVVMTELLQSGFVENVAASSQSPVRFNNNNSIEWPGKDPGLVIFHRNVNVTADFGKTIGWNIVEGRDFSNDIAGDSASAIFNQSAIELMKLKNPIGEIVKFNDREYRIIGIANDMLTGSPYEPIEPAFFMRRGSLRVINIRVRADKSMNDALAGIESILKKHNPNAPFEFNFVNQEYARKFSDEERIGNLAAFFATLAIFISCLGLFGLASFVAEQRTKEIGIRKVMGASVFSMWKMLSKDFMTLVITSCFIAIPFATYFLEKWLSGYKYKTEISWWIFGVTVLGALLITLMTVSFQAIKAAVANPVKSLRSE